MIEQIVINRRFNDVRAAGLDANGKLLNLWFSQRQGEAEQGEIFVARVQRVQHGLNAAFVDIGADRAGFWPLKEAQLQRVKSGQMYLLQRKRAGKGDKGDKLSDKISLVGDLLVLNTRDDSVHLSRRIDDDNERQRLMQIAEEIKPEGCGLILRHASQGRGVEQLQRELQNVRQLWQNLQTIDPNTGRPGPVDLHELRSSDRPSSDAEQIAAGILSALLTLQTTRVVVDDKPLWQALRKLLTERALLAEESVELYQRSTPIFDLYAVQGEIDRALGRKVWLKSGAFLVFDQSEALCAVDVNTGKAAQKGDFAEHILRVNLEAVAAIARHIQLRNISGLIVVDFIDMQSKSAQKQVVTLLREALRQDASRCRLSRISEFGLLQLSRQRRGPSLHEQLTEACPACRGLAWRRSRASLAQDFLQALAQAARKSPGTSMVLYCAPLIGEYLRRHEQKALQTLQSEFDVRVQIQSGQDQPWDSCRIAVEAKAD